MTAPLRRVAVAVFVLFGLLLINVNYLSIGQADSLRDNPHNGRTLLAEYDRQRGPIVVGGRDVARSVATKDSLRYLRTYPEGRLFAAATGFYSFVYGATGIESAEDSLLAGTDDRLFGSRVNDLLTGREEQGAAVTLTLDRAAQQAAARGLGHRRGAVVALDPRTGAILALYSSPSYDPAPLSSHSGTAIHRAYARLSAAESQPLLDRAISRTYPPGSLFKIVTSAAALSGGHYRPTTRIPAPTALTLPQTSHKLTNFGGESCGNGTTDTLEDAFEISCNTAFGALGLKLGAAALATQSARFGIGSDLDIPLTVAPSAFPSAPDAPETAYSAIGQFDVRITPLQAAMIGAAVADHGVLMRPYLVRQVQAPDLSTLQVAQPERMGRAISATVADQLTAMMKLVVEHGTGTAAQIPGVAVAGKTGTAQHGGTAPHAWFVGFAPAASPAVVVAAVVEDGGSLGSEATGGTVAAPIVRDVIKAVLDK